MIISHESPVSHDLLKVVVRKPAESKNVEFKFNEYWFNVFCPSSFARAGVNADPRGFGGSCCDTINCVDRAVFAVTSD